MKIYLPLMLTFVLAFAVFTPAQAARRSDPASTLAPFTLVGRITTIDYVSQSVTILVLRGNTLVKPYISKLVILKTTETTLFRFTDGTLTHNIRFSDLKIGDAISTSGKLSGCIWTASRFTVGAKLDCLK